MSYRKHDESERTMLDDSEVSNSIQADDESMISSSFVCLDLCHEQGCMLVEEWQTKALEANQQPQKRNRAVLFMEGNSRVDSRTLPSPFLGKALSQLHHRTDSPAVMNMMFRNWNKSKMMTSFKNHHLRLLCEDIRNDDRTAELANDYGYEQCSTIMDRLIQNYNDNSVVNASKKTTKKTTKRRSPVARLMKRVQKLAGGSARGTCSASAIARDVGMPFTYPLACAMAHAMRGHDDEVQDALSAMNQYFESYAETALKDDETDEKSICDTYRNAMGWCGWFLYMSYRMAAYTNMLPQEAFGLSENAFEDEQILMDSIGRVGLMLMKWSFIGDDDVDQKNNNSLESLYDRVNEILQEEADTLEDVSALNCIGTDMVTTAAGLTLGRKQPHCL